MVSGPGGPLPARRIRHLREPRPFDVQTSDAGEPTAVKFEGKWLAVRLLRTPWRVDQHWWRERPIKRAYYHVAPHDGAPVTLFRDLISGAWFRQEF
jgi:hypothetical protein